MHMLNAAASLTQRSLGDGVCAVSERSDTSARRERVPRPPSYSAAVLKEATAICQDGLTHDPTRADLLHLRGLIAARSREEEFALLCFRRAVALKPDNPVYVVDLADALDRNNQSQEALSMFLSALRTRPQDPSIYRRIGRVLVRQGRHDESIAIYLEALRLAPEQCSIHGEIGDVLLMQGRSTEALERYELNRRLDPEDLEVCGRLGQAHLSRRAWSQAAACFREGLERQRDRADLRAGLGAALLGRGSTEEAVDVLREALTIAPHNIAAGQHLVCALESLGRDAEAVGAWCNLAASFAHEQRFQEAAVAYRQALARKPDCLKAAVKLGKTNVALAQPREALRWYVAAMRIDPMHGWARHGFVWASHLLEDLERGWEGFPLRGLAKDWEAQDFEQPVWDGTPIKGQRILLWADEGLGDAIQFLRYVQVVKDADAHVTVECHRLLYSIVQQMRCVDRVVARGAPLPPFDTHLRIGSLPRACRKLGVARPDRVPYLHIDGDLVEAWRRRLGRFDGATVGLVWAGEPSRSDATVRFAPLAAFAPLAGLPLRFISLQLGPQVAELLAPPPGLEVEQLLDESCSIADTAALMQNLDLIISVDTMVVHLAGALARPVWTLLRYAPDRRWQGRGERSPWYPTMRLFRQTRPGDWLGVIEDVKATLQTAPPISLTQSPAS